MPIKKVPIKKAAPKKLGARRIRRGRSAAVVAAGRKIHIASPSSGSEIRAALGITHADLRAALVALAD